MLHRFPIRLLSALCVLGLYARGTLAIPDIIPYQGRLLQGGTLAQGVFGLSLRLYDAPAGGTLLYEDSNSVTVTDGLYATFLGDQTTAGSLAALGTNNVLWLETAVNGNALAPRERIGSAFFALNAAALDGRSAADLTLSRTQGIWRVRGGLRTYAGLDAATAYAASAPGDTLEFDAGDYLLSLPLALTQRVNLVGAGGGTYNQNTHRWTPGTGSVLVGGLVFWPGASNSTLRSLGIAAVGSGDGLICSETTWSATMNLTLEDLAFFGTASNTHNCELTGRNIVGHRLRSYNSGAHGIVVKGGYNIVLDDLTSIRDFLEGVLVKASWYKGNVNDVTIRNVFIDGEWQYNASGLMVESADAGYGINNLIVQGVVVRRCPVNGVILSAPATDRWLTRAMFRDLYLEDRPISIYNGALGCSNVVFTHCTGRPSLVEPGSYAGTENVRFIQCVDGDATYDGDSFTGHKTIDAFAEQVSSGVLSNQLRAVHVTNVLCYAVAAAPVRWSTNNLAAGDPVAFNGPGRDGVYKLFSWGTVTASNVPVQGAQPGDTWLAFGPCGVPNGPTTAGDVLPGKCLAHVTIRDDGYNVAMLSGRAVSRVLFADQGGISSLQASLYTTQSPLTTAIGMQANDLALSSYLPLVLRAFVFNREVYVGAFGGGTATTAWVPTGFHRVQASFDFNGPRSTVERCARIPW